MENFAVSIWRITLVDYPPEMTALGKPLMVKVLREMPGPDRPDYWLCELGRRIKITLDGKLRMISHIAICSRWAGHPLGAGRNQIPIGFAVVKDKSLLQDAGCSFEKIAYIAIGICDENPIQTNGEGAS